MILKNSNIEINVPWYKISGIVNENNSGEKITWDLTSAAKIITNEIGAERLRALHKINKTTELTFCVLPWLLFISIWYLISTLQWGWYTPFLCLAQSIVIINFFYAVRHDALMHRQIGGSKIAYVLGILYSIPMGNTYTDFLRHEDHHVHVGYDLFEEHIAELDTRWKRWFCLTMLGYFLLFMGKLKTPGTVYPNKDWKQPAVVKRMRKTEGILILIWYITLIVLAFYFPYAILVGYFIPLIIISPVLLSLKNACQHSETDTNNLLHLSVFLRSNLVLRIIYFNSLGTGHLVHHIFPRIPFWKIHKASKLIEPILVRNNIPQRSFTEVVYNYFIKAVPYRKKWD
ncbi:MAG: fatty acid desaturase [Crocinitomicaceae bacterium]|nr:fatty acid desaturase [Crocinitomicaceae bacterium]